MEKLQHIEEMKKQLAEMERQLAALKAEVAQETKPKQWEPEGGEWWVGTDKVWAGLSTPKVRLFGLERKTREQAEKAFSEMRTYNRLLAYVAEFAPDYEFIYGEASYFVSRSVVGKYHAVADINVMDIGKVYMPESVAKELCRKLNSGEVVL